MCSKCFLKIVGKPNNHQFYLPNFPKLCENVSHKLLRPIQFLEKFLEILEWYNLQNKSGPFPYSMLQYIGRVAAPKLVLRNCLRYLQTTLIMWGGNWSQNLCEVVLQPNIIQQNFSKDAALKSATRCVLWKNVFLEILQSSQENTCARFYFLIKQQTSNFI